MASGTTLVGGLDNSATTLVDASVTTVGASSYLSLACTDVGVAATLTLGTAKHPGRRPGPGLQGLHPDRRGHHHQQL